MGKYKLDWKQDLSQQNTTQQNNIANELAEANRLKRIELGWTGVPIEGDYTKKDYVKDYKLSQEDQA